MYPPEFEYYRAETVEHALELKKAYPDATFLAGGHSLIPTMKSRLASPDVLIDVGDVASMSGVEHDEEETHVGALTTYATVATDEDVWANATVIGESASEIGDPQVRNRGTVGGNVAHADPASDLPAAVLAMDGTLHAQGPDGAREIPADDFFVGMYATALEEDELLTSLTIPHHGEGAASAYSKKPSPSSGYALVGVAAVLETDGDIVTDARVAANGVMDHAVRLGPTEDALAGVAIEDDEGIEAAAAVADEDLEEFLLMDDLQASGEFRARLLRTYARRAIRSAADRVGERPSPG